MSRPKPKQTWTEADDEILREAIEQDITHGPTIAAERLGRTVAACRLRYDRGAIEGRWPARGRKVVWPEERDAEVIRWHKDGLQARDIAIRMQTSLATIEGRLKELRRQGKVNLVRVTPQYTPASEDSVENVWRRAEEQTSRDVAKHQQRRFATVQFSDDKPIGISFITDQHIRLTGPVALQRMREDAELVRRTPGLYAVLGGDGVDNHIQITQAMVRGGSKPAEEWRLFEHYLEMFGPPGDSKVLAVISGNHDDWTIDRAGVDVLGMLVRQQKLHYSPFEVVLRCEVGKQVYVCKCRHRFSRYGSSFNPNHKTKRMWEMGDDDFDVGVIAHDHEPGMEPFWKQGRLRISFRPGSYQYCSSYSETHGMTRYLPTCPTVLLFPEERRFSPYMNIWDAAEVLNLYRQSKVA